MQGVNTFFCVSGKMSRKIFILLLLLGEIHTSKIGVDESEKFPNDLKTCLSTLVVKLCPACTTIHLVIPVKSNWQADALASHFSESSQMYAIAINTLDQPGYENPSFDLVNFYLVNSEADLKLALQLLRQTESERSCVILVNFHSGHNLGNYLRDMIPLAWKNEGARRVVFAAFIEGNVQVFGTSLDGSRISNVGGFRQLSICDTHGLTEVSQLYSKVIESQKPIATVVVKPILRPYVSTLTNDPKGVVGELMKVVGSVFNFTTKYVWSVETDDFPKFLQGDGLRIAFNVLNVPKTASEYPLTALGVKAVWAIAMPDVSDSQNILASPFENNMIFHFVLLTIYTVMMIYLSRDIDKSRIMLRLFGMFFGVGVGWLPRKAFYRCLVILWCFTTYNVLVQAYLAALTSNLSTPIVPKSFHNTDDLMESKTDVMCLKATKDFYCDLGEKPGDRYICEKCDAFQSTWGWKNISSNGFRTNKTSRPFAIAIDSLVFKSYLDENVFRVMEDSIGSWPGMLYSNADPRYMKKMMRIIRVLSEAGITQYWVRRHSMKNFTSGEVEDTILNMRNLNGIFIILYVGWSCSIIIFLIELLMNWYRKKRPLPCFSRESRQ